MPLGWDSNASIGVGNPPTLYATSASVIVISYRKSGKFRCWNIFVVPVDYEIKYHEIFSTLKIYSGEILERACMCERTYVQQCGPHIRESLTTLLPTSLGFVVYSSD